jgi:hypothetical protein
LDSRVQNHRIRVINAGVDGIGLQEEIHLLADNGIQADSDLVLYGFYLNDSRPPWGFPSEFDYPGWWRRHSRLVDTIYRNFVLRQWVKKKDSDFFKWVYTRHELNWRYDRKDFLRLAADGRHDWGAAWCKSTWPSIADYVAISL